MDVNPKSILLNLHLTDKPGKSIKRRSDAVFTLLVLLITIYGTLMVFSAGSAYAEARYDDRLYFVNYFL